MSHKNFTEKIEKIIEGNFSSNSTSKKIIHSAEQVYGIEIFILSAIIVFVGLYLIFRGIYMFWKASIEGEKKTIDGLTLVVLGFLAMIAGVNAHGIILFFTNILSNI